MEIVSPLTQKGNIELIEEIKTSDILKLYHKLGFTDLAELKPYKQIGLYKCKDTDLRFFYPQAAGGAEFYERLQGYDWYYLEEKSEYFFAETLINKGDTVLDVGCGRGQFGSKIASSASFTGLEFNDEAIRKATSAGLNVIKQSVEEHAEQNPNKYDFVTAFQVLEHISDLRSFIGACLKTVKPGGKLIFSVPSYDSLVSVQLNHTLNMPPHHLSWWSDRALKSLENLYNMNLLTIHHEDLDEAHKKWYCFLIISQAIKSIVGFKSSRKVVDTSFSLKMIHGVAKYLAPILKKGLIDTRLTPYGHSVTAVYQKPI